ncbi:outer membrane receptor for ferrienterochelin and colicin [Lewinella marina]|uniref:TonB-dependent receptor n=1 Tax=Neolewinella marina TaxID=438751 RepID=A0A2G0CJ77_9BACT|nr:TonB-dependent receptor [Neolewinella marina]NJB84812.1 outer membrane receptor for ferrienterochelin and colicin [Neolewinella marina]PHL00030.1 TonB-dependent receptor [Neolewinella marina]
MKRPLLLTCFLLLALVVTAQTALSGKVTDTDNGGEPLPFAAVSLFRDGSFVQGTTTDLSGNYFFSNIDPATYDIEVNYTGYPPTKLTGIPVLPGRTNVADVEVSNAGGVNLDVVVVTDYEVPLIEVDNTTSGQTITASEIQRLPTRNINQLASITAGAASADEGSAITIRGSRSNATDYYVDGVRVRGSLLPESEIEQLQVITGGLEARYGDVTGGIISVTTKGPSTDFNLSAEAETSEGLDDYGNSLVGVAVSGPLLKQGNDRAILGYRFSGRYTYRRDDDPSAVPIYRAREDVIADLEANPVILRGGLPFVAADFLTNADVEALDTRPFEASDALNLNGKLDARLSDAIDVSLSGYYGSFNDQFTPSESFGNTWRTYNASRNPTSERADYRGNFRFRHRLGGSGVAGESGNNRSVIQNASYTLQLGIENNAFNVADPVHQDRLFDYGYVGRFEIDYIPVFALELDDTGSPIGAFQADYREVLRRFDPTTSANPILSNYNNFLGYGGDQSFTTATYGVLGVAQLTPEGLPIPTLDRFASVNGRTQTLYRDSWGFHANVGTVYNSYFSQDNDTYTFNANANFEIVPGNSDLSRHSIQFGVVYEQRVNRQYSLSPSGLWTVGRQLINRHLNAVDTANRVINTIDVSLGEGFFSYEGPADVVAPTIETDAGTFYRRIREDLGVPLDQYVNIDGLSPDQLSLDQFSAQELTFAQLIDYVGYDYLGNEVEGTFDDFFAIDPVTGERKFTVAPNRPIYASAYLQDKFTINNMIFRVGVRADRYDANTKVLKDPYSLYEIIGAEDFHANFGGERPGNIGDDYVVYTTEEGGTDVRAYRFNDNWFRADGTPTNGPQEIEGIRTGLVFPRYANPAAQRSNNFIKSEEFTTATSFEDYEVQFNIMPRLAFSFPISGEANFFAHYDVLVQRPSSNTLATALDYYYFVERPGSAGAPFNNPALRPERTIDYEVGFKTKLSNSSAITLAAYYKELRDMIQLRTYFPVPLVNQYTTYDNQDFGTVKGFSFTYDLRRTSNVTVNANYTLQFADGTGSNATSQRGLTNRGNLRTLFPLSFDERHRVNLVVDYRFDSRNGTPRWLDNSGINLQGVTVSGRPYTATFIPSELGGSGTRGAINGSRNPWNFTLNGQIEKNFQVAGRGGVNVYFRVSNILDRQNIIGVYSATGSPDDPGFLQSSFGRDQVESLQGGTRPVESYLDSYQWRVLNSDFFSLPRRMYVGVRFGL